MRATHSVAPGGVVSSSVGNSDLAHTASIEAGLLPPNGLALNCRQGPPPWSPEAPTFDARLYHGRFGPGP